MYSVLNIPIPKFVVNVVKIAITHGHYTGNCRPVVYLCFYQGGDPDINYSRFHTTHISKGYIKVNKYIYIYIKHPQFLYSGSLFTEWLWSLIHQYIFRFHFLTINTNFCRRKIDRKKVDEQKKDNLIKSKNLNFNVGKF